MRNLFRASRIILGALVIILASSNVQAEADPFDSRALRGVTGMHVRVEGIPDNFERYGLTAARVRENAEQRLAERGINVLAAAAAVDDPSASQLNIKLYANEGTYSLYSYRVTVALKRKVPLNSAGDAFLAETVWSEGQNGVLNPSDLSRIYAFVDVLVGQFLGDYARHNP